MMIVFFILFRLIIEILIFSPLFYIENMSTTEHETLTLTLEKNGNLIFV